MKKLVGLLALTLAISGVAYSDQDVIKSIKVTAQCDTIKVYCKH